MSRFHSCFSLGCRITGASRGAFDPDARRAHFTAPRAKPFQPRGFSLEARLKNGYFSHVFAYVSILQCQYNNNPCKSQAAALLPCYL